MFVPTMQGSLMQMKAVLSPIAEAIYANEELCLH